MRRKTERQKGESPLGMTVQIRPLAGEGAGLKAKDGAAKRAKAPRGMTEKVKRTASEGAWERRTA